MFHDGYEHYAHSGDSYEMRFVGTQVEIWASQDPGHGIYTVTIDGEDAGEAMGTGESRVHQQLIYTSPELENTEHTIKVELVGQEDMAIQLDYLKVYHEEMAPTSIMLALRDSVNLIGRRSCDLVRDVKPAEQRGFLPCG